MKKTYLELLKDPRWQKKRLEIMQRDNFACKICLCTTKELHIHHHEYINGYMPWEYPDEYLVTYCADCHLSITRCIEADKKGILLPETIANMFQ